MLMQKGTFQWFFLWWINEAKRDFLRMYVHILNWCFFYITIAIHLQFFFISFRKVTTSINNLSNILSFYLSELSSAHKKGLLSWYLFSILPHNASFRRDEKKVMSYSNFISFQFTFHIMRIILWSRCEDDKMYNFNNQLFFPLRLFLSGDMVLLLMKKIFM